MPRRAGIPSGTRGGPAPSRCRPRRSRLLPGHAAGGELGEAGLLPAFQEGAGGVEVGLHGVEVLLDAGGALLDVVEGGVEVVDVPPDEVTQGNELVIPCDVPACFSHAPDNSTQFRGRVGWASCTAHFRRTDGRG